MTRASVILIVLAVTHGALALWGWWEHDHRVAAQAKELAAQAQLQICQNAAAAQNSAVEQMRAQASAARERAARATAQAKRERKNALAEHARVQAMLKKPHAKTCDAAWDDIEKGS